jgi:hypothetical protein
MLCVDSDNAERCKQSVPTQSVGTRIKSHVGVAVVLPPRKSLLKQGWHYPLYLTFDSETMPEWFGMPNDKDLPSTFSIEYVRAWKTE